MKRLLRGLEGLGWDRWGYSQGHSNPPTPQRTPLLPEGTVRAPEGVRREVEATGAVAVLVNVPMGIVCLGICVCLVVVGRRKVHPQFCLLIRCALSNNFPRFYFYVF